MKEIIKILIIGLFSIPSLSAGAQKNEINLETGAKSWETHIHGVHFSLTQILPIQAKAFYVNRGFTLNQIERYASSCIFMTIIRNDNAPGTIHFLSNNWSVLVDGKPHSLILVDNWVQQLTTDNIKKSALIAFRWAQFPPEQEYEPGGDWNQGMLSVGLPADSQFDIIAHWDIEGKIYDAKLQGVKCAK